MSAEKTITVRLSQAEAGYIGMGLRTLLRETPDDSGWTWPLAFMFGGVTAEEVENQKLGRSDMIPEHWDSIYPGYGTLADSADVERAS